MEKRFSFFSACIILYIEIKFPLACSRRKGEIQMNKKQGSEKKNSQTVHTFAFKKSL